MSSVISVIWTNALWLHPQSLTSPDCPLLSSRRGFGLLNVGLDFHGVFHMQYNAGPAPAEGHRG